MLRHWMACILHAVLFVTVVLAHSGPKHSIIDCTAAATSGLKAGDYCASPWRKLRTVLLPTQRDLGFAWMRNQHDDHFSSKKTASKYFGTPGKDAKHTFPAVLGPQGKFYLTDRHHHLTAVEWGNDPDVWALDITIKVVADLSAISGADEFWAEMKKNHNAFLYSQSTTYNLPRPITPSELPTNWGLNQSQLGGFKDSIWRSLAGFASHIDDQDVRCYVKECKPFVDFEWAYLICAATTDTASTSGPAREMWSSTADRDAFSSEIRALDYPSDPAKVSTADWFKLGESVSSGLCHAAGVPNFDLPTGFPSTTMDGWRPKDTKMPPNPDCSNTIEMSSANTVVV